MKTLKKKNKDFILHSEKSNKDPLTMKLVYFNILDGNDGSELVKHFGGLDGIKPYLPSSNSELYLVGTCIGVSKNASKQKSTFYDVQWEESILGTTCIDHRIIISGISLAKHVKREESKMKVPSADSESIFTSNVCDALLKYDDVDEGNPYGSDPEDMNDHTQYWTDNESEDNDDNTNLMKAFGDNSYSSPYDNDGQTDDMEEEKDGERFHWRTGQSVPLPSTRSQRGVTKVKEQYLHTFATPKKSFLAFVPLRIFKSIAIFSNNYAHSIMEKRRRTSFLDPNGIMIYH